MLFVLQHGPHVAETAPDRQERQRFELRAYADDIGAFVPGAERVVIDFVIAARGIVFHPHPVVPVALVIHGDQTPVAEGVGDAEHQAGRRGELPVVTARIFQYGREGVRILVAVRTWFETVGVVRVIDMHPGIGVGLIGTVDPVIGRGVESEADSQILNGPVDHAELEVDPCAVQDDFLVEVRIEQLVVQVRIGAVAGIDVIFSVIVGFALIQGLNAERGPDIELVVQVESCRNVVFAYRAIAYDGRVVADIDVVADPGRLPPAADLIRESGLVAEDRTPEPGVEVAPVEAAGDLIPVDTAVLQHVGENVGDRADIALCIIGVLVVEVLQAVVAEPDIDAHERSRSFVNIGRKAEVADRKPVFTVGVECRSVVFRPCETHQRRDRNFVAPVHAQARRVDRHGRKIRSEGGEGACHGHRPRRSEAEGRLREFEEVGRGDDVTVHQ